MIRKRPLLAFTSRSWGGGQCRRHCVVQLTPTAHRCGLRVRIDATADEWGVENRMVLIDLSEQAACEVSQVSSWGFQNTKAREAVSGLRS